MNKNQENFYKSDSLWSVYGMNSKEEFYKKINLSPKFHDGVPEDISNEFKTIEYLIVLSYHHAGFLDEAVTKSLVAIEIAIKLKAKQLGISLELKNEKNRKKRSKTLAQLTKEVLCKVGLTSLQPEFDRTRSMRNRRVHKDAHTFMGVVGYPINNIRLIINLINQLFLEESVIKNSIKKENEYKRQLLNFQEKPMILEFNNKRILINNILSFKYIKYHKTELLLLLVEPVLTDAFCLLEENPSRNPLLITFKEFNISKEQIIGLDQDDKKQSIKFTDRDENIIVYNKFVDDKGRLSDINKTVYDLDIIGNAPWEMEKIMFENSWGNNH